MLRRAVKGLLLILFLLAGLIMVYLTPLKDLLRRGPEISDYLKTLGWRAPMVFVLATAALTALGVPRLLLCPIAGMSFLFYRGLLWSQLGTLLGFYVTFLFVRWGGRDMVLRKWPRLNRLAHAIRNRGAPTVFLIRQLPLGGFYLNIMLGLTHVRHRDFLLGTMIGILPEAIPATLIGASAKQVTFERITLYALLAVTGFLLVGSGVQWLLRHSSLPVAGLVREALSRPERMENDNAGKSA